MRNLILATLCLSLVSSSAVAVDWQKKLDLLDELPQTDKVKHQRAIVYNNISVEAQRKKDWNTAEKWLKKAISEDRKGGFEKPLAMVYLSQAFDSYKKRANREYTGYMHRHAKLLAERALTYDRELADAYLLISDIERVNQKMTAAKRALEKAKRIDKSLPGLQQRMDQIERESKIEKSFSKSTNSFFDVRYENTIDKETASGLRLAMTTARTVVARDYNFSPKHKIVVLVYSSDAFSRLRIGPHWAGGLYDGKIRLPLDGTDNLKFAVATLFHEYTHAVIHDLGRGNCPRWLNEGLSEVQAYKIKTEPDSLLRAAAKRKHLLRIFQLDDALTSQNAATASLGYQQSHSIAEFLTEKYGYRRVKRLLEEMGKEKSFEAALKKTCSISANELETKWQSWLPARLKKSS